MVRVLLALACVIGSACYPGSTTGVKHVGQLVSDPIVDTMGKLTVRTDVTESSVRVLASWPRTCHRNVTDIVEVSSGSEIRMVGGGAWGILWVPLLILAYPVGIIDVAITGVGVIANPQSTKKERRPADPVSLSCPLPAAHVPVHLTMPSGAVIDTRTDALGRYKLELAESERAGAVTVRVDPTELPRAPQVADADQPPGGREPERGGNALSDRQILEGVNGVRDQILACGPKLHIAGTIGVRVSVNNRGRVSTFHAASASPVLVACLGAALADARFPVAEEGGHAMLNFQLVDAQPTQVASAPTPVGPPTASPVVDPPKVVKSPEVARPTSAAAPAIEPHDPKTKELATKAYDRARTGKCGTAKALGVAIRDADPDYYAKVFLVDSAIAACMK